LLSASSFQVSSPYQPYRLNVATHPQPLAPEQRSVYDRFWRLETALFSFAHFDHFQENIGRGLPNDWHCRAGGRFLYVCEDGLVHYCSQQRGRPGIPLDEYTVDDIPP